MDRNVDRAFGISLSIITYSMFLAIISVMYIAGYAFFDLKAQSEGMNQSLIKTGAYSQETEDVLVYVGKTRADKDHEVKITTKESDYVLKDSVANNILARAKKSGEAVTGAAILTEITSLPDTVRKVTISGSGSSTILYNDPDHPFEPTVQSGSMEYLNIPYYVNSGDTQSLFGHLQNAGGLDLTDTYWKFYTYGEPNEPVYDEGVSRYSEYAGNKSKLDEYGHVIGVFYIRM